MNYNIYSFRFVNNQNNVYKIANQPIVSRQLTGLWFSPDWHNQGISINTGKRQDGAEYLFISLYIYKDGHPFWVAGTQNIDNGSESISLDLYEFTGPSMISGNNNQEVERYNYGTITITPMACNLINLFIATE